MLLRISNTASLWHAHAHAKVLRYFVYMLMLEAGHVRCCHPRAIISSLRLVHTYGAIILALEVDWDKFTTSVRWRALSPLSRALLSSDLQLFIYFFLCKLLSFLAVLILQLCQCKHSFAIRNAFGHLAPLLLHTYAIIAWLEAQIVGIDWHSHVHITNGIVVVKLELLAIDKIFRTLSLTQLNANFMHVVRLCLIHEGLLVCE